MANLLVDSKDYDFPNVDCFINPLRIIPSADVVRRKLLNLASQFYYTLKGRWTFEGISFIVKKGIINDQEHGITYIQF